MWCLDTEGLTGPRQVVNTLNLKSQAVAILHGHIFHETLGVWKRHQQLYGAP